MSIFGCQAAGPEFKERLTDPKKGGLHRHLGCIFHALSTGRITMAPMIELGSLEIIPILFRVQDEKFPKKGEEISPNIRKATRCILAET